jgi:hypothetical protein
MLQMADENLLESAQPLREAQAAHLAGPQRPRRPWTVHQRLQNPSLRRHNQMEFNGLQIQFINAGRDELLPATVCPRK